MSAKNTHMAIMAVIISIFTLAGPAMTSAQGTDANNPSAPAACGDVKATLQSIMTMANEPGSLPKVGVNLNCINGSKLQLNRAKKTLFILLWNTNDPNKAEFRAFANLFFAGFDNPEAQFLAINLDDLDKKKKVVAELLKNPCLCAQVIAAEPTNKVLRKFRTIDLKKATLAIVRPTGQIRYLGNACGLEPQEILGQLSKKTEKPEPVLYRKQSIEVDEDEFNPQAEKLLEHARMFIRIGSRMTAAKSYGKPITICRQVIRDYPDTKYAGEARLLLRQIPERYHKRFKITDEELGL